jgi:hypothetical protein
MTANLSYKINDCDNHFREPADIYARYMDPRSRGVTPYRTGSNELGAPVPLDVVPGILLDKLNPLQGLSDGERARFRAECEAQKAAYSDPDLRLALMDRQDIDKCVMFPESILDIEYDLMSDIDALYANVRAFNRWVHDEIGYSYKNRIWMPAYLPLADVELSVQELEVLLATGCELIQIRSGYAHGGRADPNGGRSVADPVFDPLWRRVDEAGMRVAVHLSKTGYAK